MALRGEALRAYRKLLRACRETFANDVPALSAALKEARHRFEQERHNEDETKIKELLGNAEEATNFLRTNIVQAKCDHA